MTNTLPENLSKGFTVLFCIPFISVGVAATGILYWSLYKAHQAARWVEVPAMIEHVELKVHRDSDGNTYSVDTRYRYEFAGKAHTSDRVSFSVFSSDSDQRWHRNLAKRLKQHKRDRTPYRCFVDPDDPTQAVLDRDLRYTMVLVISLFGAMFGGVGAVMALSSIGTSGSDKQRELAKASGQPWLARSDWQLGEIRIVPMHGLRVALPVMLLLIVVALPSTWLLPRELKAGNPLALLALIGPLAVCLPAVKIVSTLRRQATQGTSRVRLAAVPGVIGGAVAGVIETGRKLDMAKGVHVTLRCDQTSGNRRRQHSPGGTETQWQDEQTILTDLSQAGSNRTAIPFDFAIPYGLPESAPDAGDKVDWILTARSLGAGPGVDIECELPVFVTDDSRQQKAGSESLVSNFQKPTSPIDVLTATGVRIDDDGHRKRIRISGQKSLITLVALMLFAVGLLIAAVVIDRFDGPWIFEAILGSIGLLCTFAFAHTLLWRCRIDVASGAATIRNGLLLLIGRRNIPLDQLQGLAIRMTTQVNHLSYYQVYLQPRHGNQILVGKGIQGKLPATRYAEAIWREVLGTEPPEVSTLSFADRKRKVGL